MGHYRLSKAALHFSSFSRCATLAFAPLELGSSTWRHKATRFDCLGNFADDENRVSDALRLRSCMPRRAFRLWKPFGEQRDHGDTTKTTDACQMYHPNESPLLTHKIHLKRLKEVPKQQCSSA